MNKKREESMMVFMRYLIVTGVLGAVTAVFLGCASIKEAGRGVAGISTKILEEKRDQASKKVFTYDYNTCYGKVKDILVKSGSYIYAEDTTKHLIAVYLSEEDTTPVGIFLQELSKGETEVQVSSPSTFAKELILDKISSGLKEAVKPQVKEEESNEKK
jgi:hypothetical protein